MTNHNHHHAPEWLSPEARQHFERLYPILSARDDETRLRPEDVDTLAQYVHLSELYKTLAAELAEGGVSYARTYRDGRHRDICQMPSAKTFTTINAQLIYLARGLGLSAAARQVIRYPDNDSAAYPDGNPDIGDSDSNAADGSAE